MLAFTSQPYCPIVLIGDNTLKSHPMLPFTVRRQSQAASGFAVEQPVVGIALAQPVVGIAVA
jgi:hypothetical protein